MTPNTCPKADEYRGTLIDIALDDTAHCDALKLAEVIRHVDACSHCKAAIIEYQHLIATLRPRVPDISPHRIAMLESAVRAKMARMHRRPRILRWAAGITVGAAVVIACVMLWPSGDTQSPQGHEEVAEAPEASADQPRTVAAKWEPMTPAQKERLDEAAELRKSACQFSIKREFGKAQVPLRKVLELMRGILGRSPHGDAALAAHYEKYRCYELLGEDYQRERAFRGYTEQIRVRNGKEAAARALLDDGRRLMRKRNSTIADRRLSRALELCPTGSIGSLAHALQAVVHERQRAFDRAYREYQMALALKPPLKLESSIRYRMANIKVQQGQLDAAIAEARTLCALPNDLDDPGKRVMHQCLLAKIYERKGDLVSAVREFNSAIAQGDPVYSDYAATQIKRLRAKAMDMD